MKQNSFHRFFCILLPVILLLTSSSCTTIKTLYQHQKSPENKKEEPHKSSKINTKKLAKEAAYMIAWDIAWAITCDSMLGLSDFVCLAVDTVGDASIIAYHNFKPKKKKSEVTITANATEAKNEGKKETEEDEEFNPIEFVLGIGLMVITLAFI